MTQQPWKIVLGLALAAQLVACTEKSYGPPEHKAPIETQGPSDLGELEDPTPASLNGMLTEKAFQDILDANPEESEARAQEIMVRVVNPIAARLLNSKTLTDRELVASTEYFRYLKLMQEGILRVSRMDLGNAELAKIFERYENLVLDPCVGGAACLELKFVARDGRYAMVLMYLTKVRKPVVKDAWRNLSYSMDFGLFPNSTEYSSWALDTMTEYLKYLSQQPIEVVREDLVRTKKLANQIVLSIQGRNDTVAAYFERVDIWGEDPEGDLTRSILREALWTVLIDGYAIVRGEATRSFAGYVDRQLSDFEDKVLGKFRTDPNWKLAFKSLNLSDMSQVDRTLLFVIDQAYTDKISVGNALTLLATLRPSNDDLIAATEQYIQIQFAKQLIRTQDELKTHLGDPEKYRSIFLLQQQLNKSKPLEVEWAKFQERAVAMKSLIESQSAQGDAITGEQNRKLDTIFNKMDRNIKWFSIYPNMLPVVYYMSKANLADSIQILWFRFQLNSDMIFKWLFDGGLGGWFNFTNAVTDNSKFSAPEVLLSFRNALLSGLFDSYKIPVSDFLSESTDRLTAKTVARLENTGRVLYDKLLVDYEAKMERSLFSRTIRYCKGDKTAEEVVEFRDLMRYLSPYAAELDGGMVRGISSSKAAIHDIRLPGDNFPEDGIYNIVDWYRTDDMSYLDMIEKMITMYEDYLKEAGKTDPGLEAVKAKVLKVRQRFSHLYGELFQITRNYHNCQDKLRNEFKQRIMQVLTYEQIYINRAFADVQKVAANPALLEEVNATYRKTYPDIENIQTFDRIINKDGQFHFIFNKADFMLRLREYLLTGVKDGNGNHLPAIAPRMRIQIPARLLAITNGYGDYKFFYSQEDFTNVELRQGMSVDEFTYDYMSVAFYSDSGDLMEPVSNVHTTGRPWVNWFDIMVRGVPFTKTRTLLLGSLYKLGKFRIYDFDKKGCHYNMLPEELEKEGCATEAQITAEEILQHQQQILNFANISKDYESLLKRTGASLIMGRYTLMQAFFSSPQMRPLGVLDSFRFLVGKEGLGFGVIFPGEEIESKGYQPPHDGYISRAIDYHVGIASNGDPLLRPKPELDGKIKELYQGYVDREWAPIAALEAVAEREEANGRGTYDLYLIRGYEPFKLPLLTPYSVPLRFLQLDLNRKTDFIFSHEGQ